MTTTKKFAHSFVLRLLLIAVLVATFVLGNLTIALAAPISGETVATEVIKIICTIARLIGVVLAVWGIVQMILAFRNEDADSKTKATMTIVVGALLFGLSFVIKPLVELLLGTEAANSLVT